jgi:hypothetical protein
MIASTILLFGFGVLLWIKLFSLSILFIYNNEKIEKIIDVIKMSNENNIEKNILLDKIKNNKLSNNEIAINSDICIDSQNIDVILIYIYYFSSKYNLIQQKYVYIKNLLCNNNKYIYTINIIKKFGIIKNFTINLLLKFYNLTKNVYGLDYIYQLFISYYFMFVTFYCLYRTLNINDKNEKLNMINKLINSFDGLLNDFEKDFKQKKLDDTLDDTLDDNLDDNLYYNLDEKNINIENKFNLETTNDIINFISNFESKNKLEDYYNNLNILDYEIENTE